MTDLQHDAPMLPDDVGEDASLAPATTPVPEADRRRLEALLRELLRDDGVRELLCPKEELATGPHEG